MQQNLTASAFIILILSLSSLSVGAQPRFDTNSARNSAGSNPILKLNYPTVKPIAYSAQLEEYFKSLTKGSILVRNNTVSVSSLQTSNLIDSSIQGYIETSHNKYELTADKDPVMAQIHQLPDAATSEDLNSSAYSEIASKIRTTKSPTQQIRQWKALVQKSYPEIEVQLSTFELNARQIINSQQNIITRARCYYEAGNAILSISPNGALEYFLAARDLAIKSGDLCFQAEIAISLAKLFSIERDRSFAVQAEANYFVAAQLFFQKGDYYEATKVSLFAAENHLYYLSDSQQSVGVLPLLYCKEALASTRGSLVKPEIISLAYHVLGLYFSVKGAQANPTFFQYAETFERLALLNALQIDDSDVKRRNVAESLNSLAWIEGRQHKIIQAIRHIENAIKIDNDYGDSLGARLFKLNQVGILLDCNKLQTAQALFSEIRSTNQKKLAPADELILGNMELKVGARLFHELGNEDSATYFLARLYYSKQEFTSILSLLDGTLKRYDRHNFDRVVSEQERTLVLLNAEYLRLSSSLHYIQDSLSNAIDSLDTLKIRQGQSTKLLAAAKDSLFKLDTAVKNRTKELDEKTAKLKDEEKSNAIFRRSFIIGGAAIIIVAVILYSIFRHKKKLEIKELENRRDLLMLEAQAKFHDLRTDLGHTASLFTDQGGLAYTYFSKTSDYYDRLLKAVKDQRWTLGNEFRMLEIFKVAQNAVNPHTDVQRIFDKAAIEQDRVLFPQNVLPALLSNSIHKGQVHKQKDGQFCISISKEGDLLFIHVFDNGIGTTSPEIIEEDHAIGILYKRANLLMRLAGYKGANPSKFTTDGSKGMSIKFLLPYAEIQFSHRRG